MDSFLKKFARAQPILFVRDNVPGSFFGLGGRENSGKIENPVGNKGHPFGRMSSRSDGLRLASDAHSKASLGKENSTHL